MRPLDRIPSIKVKFGVVIVAAVGMTGGMAILGVRWLGLPIVACGVASVVLGLALVPLLARGMTSPLREMEAAATAMAAGRYVVRVTSTSRDEVGRLARAFNEMAAELGEVDRTRRELIANVSHELRTPISALQAALENVVDGVQPASPEKLEAMLAQVRRLGRLVGQLLDLSRLEGGGVPLHREAVPVRTLLEDAVREARLGEAATGSATVELAVDVAPPDLATVADRERLHQVVANLLDNALRHSPAGTTVTLRGRAEQDGTRLEVVDRGPGIPEAQAARVFERFYRSDGARTDDGGTGLGLAIARWIVELHDGQIRVEDARPGCRMVVDLPRSSA